MTLSLAWLVAWSDTTNNQSLQNTTEWPQRHVTFETFDQRDEKTLLPTYKPTHLPTYLTTYLPTYLPTSIEPPGTGRLLLLTYNETFDQSDEETWPDQKIPTYLPTYPPTYLPTHIGDHIDFLQNCHQFWWFPWIFANFGDFFIENFSDSLKFSLFFVNNFSPILVRFSLSKMSPILVTFL